MQTKAAETVDVGLEAAQSPSTAQLAYALDQARLATLDRSAPQWLRTYYQPDGGYAGNSFLTVEPNDPWNITASDLYAISLLNVKAGPQAARRLLESHENRLAVSTALRHIPADADLATADDAVWEAAHDLYRVVKPLLGTNAWVTASKLCARKRPRFFPVRDRVVTVDRLKIGREPRIDWAVYRHLITDPSISEALSSIVREVTAYAAQPVTISDPKLKVLDVLLWMSAQRTRRS